MSPVRPSQTSSAAMSHFVSRQHDESGIASTSFNSNVVVVPHSASTLLSTEPTSFEYQPQKEFDDTPAFVEESEFDEDETNYSVRTDIEREVVRCIHGIFFGDPSRFSFDIGLIDCKNRSEFDQAARTVVSVAICEPRYCEACAVLSLALQLRLPVLPSPGTGKRGERFSHALLDACQTEFEALLLYDTGSVGMACGKTLSPHTRHACMRGIILLAGRLHCHGLLGTGVVKQMVNELSCSGAVEWAQQLLQFVGVGPVPERRGRSALGVVPEEELVVSEGC